MDAMGMNRSRMGLLSAMILLSCCLPAAGQANSEAGDPKRDTSRLGTPDLRLRLAWQIALDRAGFSPGIIDGKVGPKAATAVRMFQASRGLIANGAFDEPTAQALGVDPGLAIGTYTIAEADPAQIGPVPTDWNEKARLPRLPYPSLEELVAEKFHCSRALLAALNPGRSLAALKPGEGLRVPAAQEGPIAQGVRIEINLTDKQVHVIGSDGRPVGLFHCSVAKDKDKLPQGSASVAVIVENPSYRFDPAKWPEVRNVHEKLLIPPGPRNPVGLCWIGLSLPGYGMHGTPTPEMIGKTGSHGCFRLANWDAVRLGKMVRPGTPVIFSTQTASTQLPPANPAGAAAVAAAAGAAATPGAGAPPSPGTPGVPANPGDPSAHAAPARPAWVTLRATSPDFD